MKRRIGYLAVVLAMAAVGCSHAGGRVTHIQVEQTPDGVKAGFQKEFPGLAISHTDEIAMPDGSRHYELKFRDALNKYHRKMFASDGTLLDVKGEVVALPAGPK